MNQAIETTSRRIALELAAIVYGAIDEAGEEGIPSGHLYAMLTGHMSLDLYQGVLDVLKKHGFVEEKHFVLTSTRMKPAFANDNTR